VLTATVLFKKEGFMLGMLEGSPAGSSEASLLELVRELTEGKDCSAFVGDVATRILVGVESVMEHNHLEPAHALAMAADEVTAGVAEETGVPATSDAMLCAVGVADMALHRLMPLSGSPSPLPSAA
jgi:hypothetical protein